MLQKGMKLLRTEAILKLSPNKFARLLTIIPELQALSLRGIEIMTPLLVPIHSLCDESKRVDILT